MRQISAAMRRTLPVTGSASRSISSTGCSGPGLTFRRPRCIRLRLAPKRETIRSEGASCRIPAGKKRPVHLVKRRPIGDVGEHHRAFHDIGHRVTVHLERGPDVLHRLARLCLDASGTSFRCPARYRPARRDRAYCRREPPRRTAGSWERPFPNSETLPSRVAQQRRNPCRQGLHTPPEATGLFASSLPS